MHVQTTTEAKADAKRSKKDKANGSANGVANGAEASSVIPFPEKADQPDAEQQAPVEAERHPDHYEPEEPSPEEVKLADDVFRELQDRAGEMGDQAVIDNLIAIVDVHTQLRTPANLFASSGEDAEKYEVAANLNEMARILARGCPKIEVNPSFVVCYFKDHEKWTSGGQKVHGKVKRFDGFLQHHLEGMLAAIVVNYHLFATFNPRQKVFTLYRLLRELDSEGKKRLPDYNGYFEEPGLFGAGVHEEHVKIARAFVKDAPAHVGEAHQLSLMAGIFDEG